MTQTAQTIIDLTGAFSRWVSHHIIVGGEITRQIVPVLIVFGAVHMTSDQQAVLFSSISGIVAAVTGQKVTSNVRVGERITAEVERRRRKRRSPAIVDNN